MHEIAKRKGQDDKSTTKAGSVLHRLWMGLWLDRRLRLGVGPSGATDAIVMPTLTDYNRLAQRKGRLKVKESTSGSGLVAVCGLGGDS